MVVAVQPSGPVDVAFRRKFYGPSAVSFHTLRAYLLQNCGNL